MKRILPRILALGAPILVLGAIPAVAQNSPYVQITTPTPLPEGYLGVSYSLIFQATTNPPNQLLTWCVLGQPSCGIASGSNSLPPGMSLNSNGQFSGTPTTAGSYSFTIQAAFATTSPTYAVPATMMFTMTVSPSSFSITSTSPLPNAALNQPYSVTLTANATPNSVVWSSGVGLPPGLSLSGNGVISGSPTTAGTYSFTVTASISNSTVSASQNFTISVVTGQITILTASLPVAYVGQPYTATLSANTSNVTWSLTGTTPLPAGITFNGATGMFSGSTGAAGTYTFQVTASLANYASAVQNYTLYVASQPLQVSQTQIPIAVQGSPYSVSLTGIGGITPYSWSMTGNPSTDGLTISASTQIPGTGIISGTPTATGNFALTVQLSDVTSAAPAMQAFTLQVVAALSITTASLPVGAPSLAYSQTLSATGGLPPYSWAPAAGSGALPPGLTLSPAGVIGGTIAFNATGVYSFTAQVTDSGGHTATRTLSIAIGAAVTVTTPSLPDGVVGSMYSQTLAAGGGTKPYTWSITSGSLPAGLTLSSSGVVSGTPTAAGISTFTVQVTDSTPGQPLTATNAVTLRIDSPLSITTGNLSATVGVAYAQALAATGGVQPYVWTISSGTLPAGLSLSNGVINGTPSAAATATVTFVVADSAVQTATKSITITVTSAANQISITTGTNLSATVGVVFSQALAATGGTPPYTWSITSGSLPAGLSLNSGVITGTPTTAGTSTITLLVTDSQNLTASASVTITVSSPQAPSVSVTVNTGTSPAAQQYPINISLSNTYPSAITITLTLAFQSAVGGEDQLVQFLPSMGQSLTLTIPAGSTTPSTTAMLATGTTAGAITITTALTAAGATLPAPAPTVITIPKSSPVITNVTFSNTGGSLTVTVTGYSATRDMVSGNFTFSPASGSTLAQSEVTVQLGSAFTTWYQNTASYAYGSEFLLTMPFTVSGNAADVSSVSVTLTNSFGTSSAASAQ